MARWISSYISRWLMRRPFVLSTLTGIAQRFRPVWSMRKTTLVLGAAEVNGVLNRGDSFELGPVAHNKMLSGKFLLGMDEWPVYLTDKEIVRRVLEKCEESSLREIASRHCDDVVEQIKEDIGNTTGSDEYSLDLVKDFAAPIVTRIATEFFLGLKELPQLESKWVAVDSDYRSMNANQQIFSQWLCKVGSVIVAGYPAQFGLQKIAESMSIELGDMLQMHCREVIENPSGGDYCDVVTGLTSEFSEGPYKAPKSDDNKAVGLEDIVDRVQRNIAGLLVAGSTPLIHSFAVAMDQLLRQEDAMEVAPPTIDVIHDPALASHTSDGLSDTFSMHTATHPGVMKTEDHFDDGDNSLLGLAEEYARLTEIINTGTQNWGPDGDIRGQLRRRRSRKERQIIGQVYEAMRFNTTFPFLARYSPRDDVILTTNEIVCPVAAGSTVVVSQLAAMHDSRLFPKPEVFANRRRDTYMHFGAGDHECLGKSVASKILGHLVRTSLKIPGMPAIGRGTFDFDGPAVSSYVIKLPIAKDETT